MALFQFEDAVFTGRAVDALVTIRSSLRDLENNTSAMDDVPEFWEACVERVQEAWDELQLNFGRLGLDLPDLPDMPDDEFGEWALKTPFRDALHDAENALRSIRQTPLDQTSNRSNNGAAGEDESDSDVPRRGVSVFDAAMFLEDDDERVATANVKRWSDGKRPKPPSLGKCPHEGRRTLSELSEVVNYVHLVLGLDDNEKQRLRKHLKSKLRLPVKR